MEHSFNTSIAKEYDVNTAVLLNNLKFWTIKNLANNKNIYDGLCWTYNSIEALCDIFPYWTRHQLEHLIKKMIDNGLIIKGNYNENKYDRTCWYALTIKSYLLFPELNEEKFIKKLHESIGENLKIDFVIFRNQFHKFPEPIPDNKPDNKPDISDDIISPIIPLENFEQFKKEKETIMPISGTWMKANELSTYMDKGYPYQSNDLSVPVKRSSKLELTTEEMLNDNPYDIDENLINDWKIVRAKKKAPITKTAWNTINKELTKLKNKGFSPLVCFEIMVASGWQSIKEEWFKNKDKKREIDHNSTNWYFDMQNDIF